MKIAVISDIHGNLAALERVLEDMDSQAVDYCISLGDNVGYGPDPEAVLELLYQRNIASIMGNHERGLIDPNCLDWFNDLARRALLLTRRIMSPGSLDYCRSLPLYTTVGQAWCVHGRPPDSVFEYIFEYSDYGLKMMLDGLPQPICFVGHTHQLEIIAYDGQNLQCRPLAREELELSDSMKYIVNVGSVGQPRDNYNKDAKYVLWDDQTNQLTIRFVPYDAAATARKILDLGWPKFLAYRLLG